MITFVMLAGAIVIVAPGNTVGVAEQPATGPQALANHVVISEVFYDSSIDEMNCFIELYNPTSSPIDLTGWTIQENEWDGSIPGFTQDPDSNWPHTLSGTIPAYGFYLIGEQPTLCSVNMDEWGYTIDVDYNLGSSTGIIENGNNDGWLLKDDTGAYVDAVMIWSALEPAESPWADEPALSDAAAGNSYERKSGATHDPNGGNGWDTDDNVADFMLIAVPEPQNSASPPETPGGGAGAPADHVVINEILYNSKYPEETGEWIEIMNPTSSAVNLNGWTLDDGEGTWEVPGNYWIPPGLNMTFAKNGARFFQDNGYYPDFEAYGGTPAVDLIKTGDIWLVNAGEVLFLNDSGGNPVDIVVWGSEAYGSITPVSAAAGDGDSIKRSPDGYEDETAPDDENCPTVWVAGPADPRTADVNPPTVQNVMTSPTSVSCLVSWDTADASWPEINPNAISQLSYSSDPNPDAGNITVTDSQYITHHEIYLTDLTPSTTYYFLIRAEDGLGHVNYDKNGGSFYQFTTLAPDGTAPSLVSGPGVDTITDTSARVYWSTDEISTSVVFFGTSPADLYMSAANQIIDTSHEVFLTGLTPSTTYYFAIYSEDPSGNYLYDDNGGSAYSFTTTGPVTTNYYIGNLHSHTSYSDGVQFPADAFDYAKNTAQIDILAITDHTHMGLTSAQYNDIRAQADAYTDATFVGIAGQEFGYLSNHGHNGIFDADTICPLDPTTYSMSQLYTWLQTARNGGPAPAEFNHPGMGTGDDFEGIQYSATGDIAMGAFEVYNGRYGEYEIPWYADFIGKGWHLGTFGSQDNHDATWGTKDIGDGWSVPLTVFPMPTLTRDNVIQTILDGRTYAILVNRTDNRDFLHIDFSLNGQGMGSTVSMSGRAYFDIDIWTLTDNIDDMWFMQDGQTVTSWYNVGSTSVTWNPYVDLLPGSHWYYVKATMTDGGEAISGPIWVDVPAMAQPAVYPNVHSISHTPVSPSSVDTVTITATVESQAGVYVTNLYYSVDGGPYQRTLMYDDGTNGDAVPGDGIYTAQMAPLPDGTNIHYYVNALAMNGLQDTNPSDAPVHFYSYLVGPHLLINEVYTNAYDLNPAGGEESEFIEIYNPTGSAINLQDYTIECEYNYDKWAFPSYSLPAGAYAVIARDSYYDNVPSGGYRDDAQLTEPGEQDPPLFEMFDSSDLYDDPGSINMILVDGNSEIKMNNAYDALTLRNSLGTVVDAMEYGRDYTWIPGKPAPSAPQNCSLTRDTLHTDTDNSYADFSVIGNPTPGTDVTIPTINNVQHEPMVPWATQVVNVTARILDDGGTITGADVYYSINGGAYSPVSMADDGIAPDQVAGDNIWTGQIPAQAASSVIRYYVDAWTGPIHSYNPYGAPTDGTYSYTVWPHLVISEVYHNAATYTSPVENSKFIEIYNPTGAAVDLSGWQLWGEPTWWDRKWEFPAGTSIADGEAIVICLTAGDGITDGFIKEFGDPAGAYQLFEMYDPTMTSETYTDTDNPSIPNMLLPTDSTYDDQIELPGPSYYDAVYLKDAGGVTIDCMEYGIEGEDVPGSPADPADTGYSLTRDDQATDTDNSYVDFTSATPTPGVLASVLPTFDIPLPAGAGWNFISFPLSASGSPVDVLSDLAGDGTATWDIVKWYNPLDPTDPWKTYTVGKPAGLNDLASIDNTKGLWVHITDPGTDGVLTVQGAAPATTNINLYTGWNLVSYPSATPALASGTLPAQADMVAVYDGAQPYLIRDVTDLSTVTMSAGNAYWVHVTSDTVWTVTY